jgi:hypothetical protein
MLTGRDKGSLSPQHGMSSGMGCRNQVQIWRVAANILYKNPSTAEKRRSSSLVFGQAANIFSP